MSDTVASETAVQTDARDLILVLADSKRLLGTRYAEWILGAPELETGIACAAMAQDEWGHARLLYALLKDFGDDVDRLEHGREPAEYASMELLDRAAATWPEFVVLNALLDAALTVQLQALSDSSYAPLRQRVAKLIEEERFHAAHGVAWARRLASVPEGQAQLQKAVQNALPLLLRWFGAEADLAGAVQTGLVADGPDGLRRRWLELVAPVLAAAGITAGKDSPDFSSFDARTRRSANSAPDAETIAAVRGDRNRAFLMD